MQSVFKLDLPSAAAGVQEKTFLSRKSHKKSRAGCLACKKRRIKCNEARPRCSRCCKLGVDCCYDQARSAITKTASEDSQGSLQRETALEHTASSHQFCSSQQSPTFDMYSMSIDLLGTELNLLLESEFCLVSTASSWAGNVRLLQHFQATTFLTLGGPKFTQVFQAAVNNKARELPYLMHMTLAVSCAHLKRLITQDSSPRLHQCYALAEANHWQSGLRLYRKALSAETHDFDGTITATFLSIIFTFALDDNIPQDSYASNDVEKLAHAVNPLAATGGFGALRSIFGDRMMESIWRYVLMDSDDNKGTFSRDSSGIVGLPTAFVELCELDDTSDGENNAYYTIISLLTPLLRLKPHPRNFTKLVAYSGRTWPHFKPLLLRRDPRALLLISYWFALMRQVNQWWMMTRAKTECLAIVNYLCQTGDPKITALLPYPASLGQVDIGYIW